MSTVWFRWSTREKIKMELRNGLSLLLILICMTLPCIVNTTSINVLFVNDIENEIANNAFDVALKYLQRNTDIDIQPDVTRVTGNSTDAREFLDQLCKVYNDSLEEKKAPHVVIDTTIAGVPSEVVKAFTSALGLPTLSASHGQDGDLRQWRNLDEEKSKFLIQIMPPADMLPEAIRSVVYEQNISNAGVLFDDSVVMDHKYKSLLQNLPTRHVIIKVNESMPVKKQIQKLRDLDIFNFFIVGRLSTIKDVLDNANINKFFAPHFAWHAFTLTRNGMVSSCLCPQEDDQLRCSCKESTVIFLHPEPESECKDRLKEIEETYGLEGKPEITSAFYFDFTLRALLAIKSMMDKGTYPKDMNYVTCDEYTEDNPPVRTDLDYRTAIIEVRVMYGT
uniref:Uncharacterized protein n=1 Tax=Timema shepardi TaxID=629360 RepID=A0A7R9B0A4_TIMSH|nr:unnamed protein product [Timema shepardi]